MSLYILVPTASISGSAIMRRRDLGLTSHADALRGVRHAFLSHGHGAGTRDEPLRTSAWEANLVRDLVPTDNSFIIPRQRQLSLRSV